MAERAALPLPDVGFTPLDPGDRLGVVLIEKRIESLVSRRIEADRLEPSPLTYNTLGAYPKDDADKGRVWHQGAHALHLYRLRNGVSGDQPLGPKVTGAEARAERVRTERVIERAQRQLDRRADRVAEQSAVSSAGIER